MNVPMASSAPALKQHAQVSMAPLPIRIPYLKHEDESEHAGQQHESVHKNRREPFSKNISCRAPEKSPQLDRPERFFLGEQAIVIMGIKKQSDHVHLDKSGL